VRRQQDRACHSTPHPESRGTRRRRRDLHVGGIVEKFSVGTSGRLDAAATATTTRAVSCRRGAIDFTSRAGRVDVRHPEADGSASRSRFKRRADAGVPISGRRSLQLRRRASGFKLEGHSRLGFYDLRRSRRHGSRTRRRRCAPRPPRGGGNLEVSDRSAAGAIHFDTAPASGQSTSSTRA